MNLGNKLNAHLKTIKIVSLVCGSGAYFTYHFICTVRSIQKIFNSNVLDIEKKHTPEYIYIDDPLYGTIIKMEKDKETKQSIGLARIWKSLQHSLAWKLLWLCRNGNPDQRNIALEHLAALKNNKAWDCLKLAQAMDKDTAVLLAQTRGADLRYFLPPPINTRKVAISSELVSFKLREMLVAVQNINPHSCIKHFLSAYFVNVQEQAMEADTIPAKPNNVSEKELCKLCLDALHHHVSLYYKNDLNKDKSIDALIKLGILNILAELLLRYAGHQDIDLAVLKVLTVFSVHKSLLMSFFQSGLIRDLSRMLQSKDLRLSSSAAVCLANLSGEYSYKPGLYLLHPIYRTTKPHKCDLLLVHGLRGGVFVTWRQRDRSYSNPVGLMDATVSDVDGGLCDDKPSEGNYLDPDLQQVLEDIAATEEESLLSSFEVVLRDSPIEAKRETSKEQLYTIPKKRIALKQEEQDSCKYSHCWPKDWLPQDCEYLRIIGINYLSSLSEWLERCPAQSTDITAKANEIVLSLHDAGVGNKGASIVWLAHSMGGLVVKKLLITAAQNEYDHRDICEKTKAVFFYSTPHKGSALATMPRAAEAILWPSNDVKLLKVNSPALLEMNDLFVKYADQYSWETISFAESKPTLVTAFKVPIHFVESFSADLGRGAFYKLPLDHLCICKPATRQSLLYTSLLEIVKDICCEKEEVSCSKQIVDFFSDIVSILLQWYSYRFAENTDDPNSEGYSNWTRLISS